MILEDIWGELLIVRVVLLNSPGDRQGLVNQGIVFLSGSELLVDKNESVLFYMDVYLLQLCLAKIRRKVYTMKLAREIEF